MSKVLYLNPFSGIAGDMFLGLLVDLGLDVSELNKELEKLDVKYELKVEKVVKNGITATSTNVVVPEKIKEGHHHMNKEEIFQVLDMLDGTVKEKARMMFDKLLGVESEIHGMSVDEIHLHEVGAIDAIVEIVGAIVGLELLDIEEVYSSSVNTGSGFVDTQHGKLPVPAPATVELLKGVPINLDSSESIKSELVTPTGALILHEFVEDYKNLNFRIDRVGYGAGDKDLGIPNVLRGYLGETLPGRNAENILIETNIDDMNPEFCGHLMDKLFEKGALDVYYTPIYMKKNRPAFKLTVLCAVSKKDEMIELIMRESTTIGIRILHPEKIEASREVKEIKTEYGSAKVKIARYGTGAVNIAPEYESCLKLAEKTGKPLKFIYAVVYEKAESVVDREQ